MTASCQIAKHRKSNTLEVRDVQLHLGGYSFSFDSQKSVKFIRWEILKDARVGREPCIVS